MKIQPLYIFAIALSLSISGTIEAVENSHGVNQVVLLQSNQTTLVKNMLAMGYKHGDTEIAWILELPTILTVTSIEQARDRILDQVGVTGEVVKTGLQLPRLPGETASLQEHIKVRAEATAAMLSYAEEHRLYLEQLGKALSRYIAENDLETKAIESIVFLNSQTFRNDGSIPADHGPVTRPDRFKPLSRDSLVAYATARKREVIRSYARLLSEAISSGDGQGYETALSRLEIFAADPNVSTDVYGSIARYHRGKFVESSLRNAVARVMGGLEAVIEGTYFNDVVRGINQLSLLYLHEHKPTVLAGLILLSEDVKSGNALLDTRRPIIVGKVASGDIGWLKIKIIEYRGSGDSAGDALDDEIRSLEALSER